VGPTAPAAHRALDAGGTSEASPTWSAILIRTRTAEGRSRAKAQGKAHGPTPFPSHPEQQKEAIIGGARRARRSTNSPGATMLAGPRFHGSKKGECGMQGTATTRVSQRLDLIDRVGRTLQSRYAFDEIDLYLAEFKIPAPKDSIRNSKWVYTQGRTSRCVPRYNNKIAEGLGLEQEIRAAPRRQYRAAQTGRVRTSSGSSSATLQNTKIAQPATSLPCPLCHQRLCRA